MDDIKLGVIIQRQKRLMYNVLISVLLGCGLIASVFALT